MTKENVVQPHVIDGFSKALTSLLESIYDACDSNSREYGLDYTPLSYLKTVLDLAKTGFINSVNNGEAIAGLSSEGKEATQELTAAASSLFDIIYEACAKNSASFGVSYTPLSYLRNMLDVASENFIKGLKNGITDAQRA